MERFTSNEKIELGIPLPRWRVALAPLPICVRGIDNNFWLWRRLSKAAFLH